MPGRKLIYWDADVFLSYIDASQIARHPVIDALFAEHESRTGSIEITTSVISITEVAFGAMEKANSALDSATEAKIDGFWYPTGTIRVREYYPDLAREARNWIRLAMANNLGRLSLGDAVHLATAVVAGVAEFHTYNLSDFLRFQHHVSFTIAEPTVLQSRMPLDQTT